MTSQQAVAFAGERTAESQKGQPSAAATYSQVRVSHSESLQGGLSATPDTLEGAVLEGTQKRYGYRIAKRSFHVVFSALMLVCFCWQFALPAKSSTNKGKAFSQLASCFSSDLRKRRISEFICNCMGGMKTRFLANPVFGVSPEHSVALFQKSNNGLAEAAW